VEEKRWKKERPGIIGSGESSAAKLMAKVATDASMTNG
jgi:hypothetical protein